MASQEKAPTQFDEPVVRHIATRRIAAALTAALMVLVPSLGCGSDDDDGSAPTAAATGTTADTGTGTVDEGIDSLEEAQAQLCPELSGLEADLEEVSTSGTEAGQEALAGFGSFAAALEAASAALTSAGATDAATAAEDLAASLESISTSGGEDARAAAGDAADGAQELADALQCP